MTSFIVILRNVFTFWSNQVIVTVMDDNDHTPEFTEAQYAFQVKEDVNAGHVVGKVLATDRDKDNNAKISFVINSGNTGALRS